MVTRQAEALAAAWPGARAVATLDDALADPAVGLVVIATPNTLHAPQATAALEAGKAVVIDKPFALDLAEARGVAELAAARGLFLSVFHNRRWDADFLALRAGLEGGRLGRVHTFESHFDRFRPEVRDRWREGDGPGGGVWHDLGPHLIDQALHLFGPVESAHGEVVRHLPTADADADDDAFVLLRHASGVSSRLSMNSISAAPAPRFHVLGRRGTYTKRGLDQQEPQLLAGLRPGDDGLGVEPEANWGVLTIPDDAAATGPVEPERGAYGEFYRILGDHLTTGGPVPVDPRDAIDALQIIESIHGL